MLRCWSLLRIVQRSFPTFDFKSIFDIISQFLWSGYAKNDSIVVLSSFFKSRGEPHWYKVCCTFVFVAFCWTNVNSDYPYEIARSIQVEFRVCIHTPLNKNKPSQKSFEPRMCCSFQVQPPTTDDAFIC